MNINIEQLPFGVAIINKNSMIIEDANENFFSLFTIARENQLCLDDFEELYFISALIEESEGLDYRVNDFCIGEDRAVDIIIKSIGDNTMFYFLQTKTHEPENESSIMSRLLKLREERQQFITISTELKTKCDIVEILRKREKEYMMHLKDVVNNISEGLIVLNHEGKYNFCNKAVFSVLDVNTKELKEYPNIFSNYVIEEINGNGTVEAIEVVLSYKKNISNMIILLTHKETSERKYIEFNNAPIKDESEIFIYSIVTIKDVTDIKLHERLVQEQSSFIKNVVNTMDIPIAVITYPQLEVTLANEKLKGIIRQTLGAFGKKSGKKLWNMKEILKDVNYKELTGMLMNCAEKGKECSYSPFELTTSEEKRYYKIKFKPLKDKSERTNLILMSAIDITEETCRSIELEKITNMKDEFFTVISHELRTPLTVIYSSLQLAYNIYGKEITPNINKNLMRINQNCIRLLKLINNILDISKAEAGFLTVNTVNFDMVEVTEYIVNSINTYAKVKDIELVFSSNCGTLFVNMDKDKYEKILLNLLSNAMKFTPAGKKITVQVCELEGSVILSVKDEGIGIPVDKINSIFDRFAQVNSSLSRRAEGTGIGLSLVKNFVDIMGGTIEVKSVVNEGTEFMVGFDKMCLDLVEKENYSLMDINVREKINIEFSDVD